MKQLTENEVFLRLSALCAASEQCEWNLREKMRRWGVEASVANGIIVRLYDERYLDEERFAHAYARDKMRYSRWGRQKIDLGLRQLRIAAPARRDALSALPEEEYLDILRHVLRSKLPSIKADGDYERNAKLIRFALGRGFEMKLILHCLPDADADFSQLADEVQLDADD